MPQGCDCAKAWCQIFMAFSPLAPQELSPGLAGAQAADPWWSRRVGIRGSVLAPGNYLCFQKRLCPKPGSVTGRVPGLWRHWEFPLGCVGRRPEHHHMSLVSSRSQQSCSDQLLILSFLIPGRFPGQPVPAHQDSSAKAGEQSSLSDEEVMEMRHIPRGR